MRYKSKSIRSAIGIILISVVCIIALNFLGVGTMRSATRISYIEHTGWKNWSASYTMLDGKMKHTFRPKDTQKTLHIDTITEKGRISIEVMDKEGNIIFDEDNMGTTTYDVEISGKIVVYIEADKHKGGFNIEAIDAAKPAEQSMIRTNGA